MNTAPETKPANPKHPQAEGRDTSGRFAKGNPGGPGNPYPRQVAAFRQALLNCVTEEDIIAVTRAIIEEAKDGNIAAAKLLFQYVFGKPGPAAPMNWNERDSMSGEELSQMLSAIEKVTRSAPIVNGSNGKSDEGKPPFAPIVNGSNGKSDEAKPPSAPIANGSNGGSPTTIGIALPTGSPREMDQWLERQMRRAMEALGNKPLVELSAEKVAVVNSGSDARK
jgi:hypothetical protein